MRRQLDAIQRECRRLNALRVGDQRATGRTALDVPLEIPTGDGIERAVDELGNRCTVILATHMAPDQLSTLARLGSPAALSG